MSKFLVLLIFILHIHVSFCQTSERYQATWESLNKYSAPEWVLDAKFGVFIHWGVYSVPAYGGEWYPRHMYEKDSDYHKRHVEMYGPVDKFGYKDFIPMFKAEKFDADAWLRLFKKAGFKYVVPVAEHHDGFCMYKTALSKWNAVEMGPKRDIIGEIAAATQRAGLIFGLSSHRIEHWWYYNAGRRYVSDVNDRKYEDFYGPAREWDETMTPEFMNDWLMRNIELVTNYKPQLFWFDWWIEQPSLEPYRKSFASFYYNKGIEWNKGVVINYKDDSYKGNSAILDIERGKLTGIRELPWQTDDAIGYKSWGYIVNDSFKTTKYIINNLIDIVSKNGNLLLNIGPRPDGTIPDEVQQSLLEIGDWLNVNGEAIYGTRHWKVFGEGPTKVAGGTFSDAKDKPFTAEDVRFTKKGEILYALPLDIPVKPVLIKSLNLTDAPKIQAITLIGSNEKIVFSQTNTGLTIQPCKTYPTKYAVAYKIQFSK
jgi:alpha-L-fucosidase